MEKSPHIMSEEISICKRCHRKLKDEKSKKLGYGITCYKKVSKRNSLFLFELEDTTCLNQEK